MATINHKIVAEKLNFPNFFRIEFESFNFIGINWNPLSAKGILARPWNTFPALISTFAVLLGMYWHALNHLNDLDIACYALTYATETTLGACKAMIVLYKRKDLTTFLQLIWQEELSATPADDKTIVKENKKHWRFSALYCGCCVATMVAVSSTPILIGLFKYFTKGEFAYLAALPAYHIVDIRKSLNYFVVYVVDLSVIYLVALASLAFDSFYSWSIHNVAALFKVLQIRFRDLNGATDIDGNNRTQSIIACIEYHQRIIALAELIAGIFEPIILLEFAPSSLQMCVNAFQLGRQADATIIGFLVVDTVQLFLYSYCGQQLLNESEKCTEACYESMHWQFWTTRESKLMLLPLLRAQKPCKISAIFFDVDLKSFLMVMKTASSYLTLLWSLEP